MRGRTLALMIAVNAAGWAATAAGAWLLADGLLGPAAPSAFVLLGAFALSSVIGALMPLLPAGLGPRDAALTVALTPVLGPGAAALLALALRVVSFGAELLAVAVAELAALVLARRERSARRVAVAAHGAFGAPTTPKVPSAGAQSPRTIVVVPTYDERESLPLFLERFAPTGYELLIVDDSSPDGTGELADALAATRPWMHVLHRAEKDGLGMAYRAGFRWCLERDYDVIGQMDCDLSHPPEKLAEMRARPARARRRPRARLALPARRRHRRLERDAPGAEPRSAAARRAWRSACRSRTSAAASSSGAPSCLAAIDLDELLSAGYAFQVETTQLAHLAGARIEEVPFVFSERVAGASKMTLRISLEGIRVTLALRRHHRPGAPPRAAAGLVAFGSHAPVAQWIERRPPEAEVAGSNPAGRASLHACEARRPAVAGVAVTAARSAPARRRRRTRRRRARHRHGR